MTRFAEHGVVVTGAAKGLGQAIVQAFLQEGARVAALDLDHKALQQTWHGASLQPTVCLAVDVRQHDALDAALEQAQQALGTLDVMVANAGIGLRVPALDIDAADFERVIDTNLNGLFYCNRLAAKRMPATGGAVVNMASVMGLSGGIFPHAVYQASKGAVVNLTRALALEWGPRNIRVNAVAPTFVRTPLTEGLFGDAQRKQAVMATAALGRLPEPADIAHAVLFLASAQARCITGHTLAVDSGYLAR
jgi:NAD(P)-dependent dehydrogenase (short-subunit alcohol dehydrogenase family)